MEAEGSSENFRRQVRRQKRAEANLSGESVFRRGKGSPLTTTPPFRTALPQSSGEICRLERD